MGAVASGASVDRRNNSIRVMWTMSRINGNQHFVNLGLFCVFEFVAAFTSCMFESKFYLENYVIRKSQLRCCHAIC